MSPIPPVPLVEVWGVEFLNNFYAFIGLVVATFGIIGALAGRSMALGSYGAYLIFVQYAVTVDDELLTQILYVTLVLVFVGMAFKLWRHELAGDGGPA